MFRIAKSLVKTFEQSVQDISSDRSLDVFFQSIPPQLLTPGNDTNATLHGLRVFKVEESQLQLCSFFDYIVGINNEPLPTAVNQHGFPYPDYNKIFKTLNSFSGSSIGLNVWSGKGGFYRVEYMHLIPKSSVEDIPLNTDENETQTVFESLGFSAQWYPLMAATQTYHVLNINLPDGPAVAAGLIPGEDYVVGCQDGLLITGGENILQDVVRSKANQDLVLYVYNSEADCVRPVVTHIGPDGRLGCGVGYGFIHRIPQPKLQPNSQTEDTVNNDAFVPAQVAPQQLPAHQQSTAPPQLHRKKRTIGHPASPSAMQDYFKEGKDQSPRYTPSGTEVPAPPQRPVHQ